MSCHRDAAQTHDVAFISKLSLNRMESDFDPEKGHISLLCERGWISRNKIECNSREDSREIEREGGNTCLQNIFSTIFYKYALIFLYIFESGDIYTQLIFHHVEKTLNPLVRVCCSR